MTKTKIRYFFDFLAGQERWLNRMAEQGYRLARCGPFTYHFEPCNPGEYEYAVELVGDRPYYEAKDYKSFLESAGYRVFTKNINLNLSFGKIRWRPWARGSGQLTTSPGSFNKELLIVERKRQDQPFALHTDPQDVLETYVALRRAYRWATGVMAALLVLTFIAEPASGVLQTALLRLALLLFALLWGLPAAKTSTIIRRLREEIHG